MGLVLPAPVQEPFGLWGSCAHAASMTSPPAVRAGSSLLLVDLLHKRGSDSGEGLLPVCRCGGTCQPEKSLMSM